VIFVKTDSVKVRPLNPSPQGMCPVVRVLRPPLPQGPGSGVGGPCFLCPAYCQDSHWAQLSSLVSVNEFPFVPGKAVALFAAVPSPTVKHCLRFLPTLPVRRMKKLSQKTASLWCLLAVCSPPLMIGKYRLIGCTPTTRSVAVLKPLEVDDRGINPGAKSNGGGPVSFRCNHERERVLFPGYPGWDLRPS